MLWCVHCQEKPVVGPQALSPFLHVSKCQLKEGRYRIPVPETDKQNAVQDQCFTLQTFSTVPSFTFTMLYFIPISANDSQLTYFNDAPLFHVEWIIMILLCHLSILCDYCNNVICVCSSFFLFKFKLTEYRPFVTVVQFILVYLVVLVSGCTRYISCIVQKDVLYQILAKS